MLGSEADRHSHRQFGAGGRAIWGGEISCYLFPGKRVGVVLRPFVSQQSSGNGTVLRV